MEEHGKIQKVIWAVDPLMKEKRLQLSVAKGVQTLLGDTGKIEPVYVLNTSPFLGRAPLAPELVTMTEEIASREIKGILKKVRIEQVLPAKILSSAYSGMQAEVSALLNYAKEQEADLIAVGTHGRKGLVRWLTGSFAESLMLSSKIPLLVVNPNWKASAGCKRVLFPTDFSSESKKAFERVLENIDSKNRDVTIFHHVPYFLGPEVNAAVASNPVYRETLEKVVKERQAEADAWVDSALKRGVKAQSIIDYKTQGTCAEAILKHARRNSGLIAMTGKSGKVISTVLGSTTRQVLRGAVVPVWVLRGDETARDKPLFKLTQEDLDLNLIDHQSLAAGEEPRLRPR